MKTKLASVLLILGGLLNAFGAADVPVARAPWQLELIAASPMIRHPSVVCAAPDGRVLVAEDPMDISAPANARQGRIVAFHPDGRRTIFATNLFAVFGMQYLEGKVYVLHNPRFTVLKDSGDAGSEAEDLIESTNPNPWALDWNDHVPANFKLGMDGYFYVAVGDKGIYNAKGRDGHTINLHGGGILRIRPDGTGAEVYCTGVRNILDVALTSEDEIFTYDNTDEHDWMGRLTHMVDGGYYGYPHHFIPRRPYTLWMMHDFGGGAATGTFANTEDALPPEFDDNLFLADFGKRQIIRVVIERDGGTFKVARHEELFSEMPDRFRPVGIAPSHDGKSIYICDWQHRDTKENVEVGRLWKLTWKGKTFEKAKPSWYVPTALGKKCEGTDAELSEALSHPSKNVRLTAQRELIRRRVLPSIAASAPNHARWHSIWIRHALRGTTPDRRIALPPNSSVARQYLRASPESSAKNPILVLEGLKSSNASIRFQAATALGRLPSDQPMVVPSLMLALPERDLFTRFAVETALNRLGRAHPAGSWPLIVRQLGNTNAAVRESISHALRETYDETLVRQLIDVIDYAGAPQFAREGAISALANIARKLPEWKGEWWAYHPALAATPIKTEAWEATPRILEQFQKLLVNEADLRLATIRSLTEAHEKSVAPTLRSIFFEDERLVVREAILDALTKFKDTDSAEVAAFALTNAAPELVRAAFPLARFSSSAAVHMNIAKLVADENLAPEMRAEAIKAAGHFRLTAVSETVIAATKSSDREIRNAAVEALGKMGGAKASETLLSLFTSPDTDLQRLAANALGNLKETNAVPALLAVYQKSVTREAALEALLRIPDARAVPAYLDALGNANPTTREQARKALEPFAARAWPSVRERIPTMRPVEIAELQKIYPGERDLTLLWREKAVPKREDYIDAALQEKGDVHRGRRIFHDRTGVACIQCHTVAGEGNAVGPDMTTIGAQFPRSELIEHILEPSKSVREGYQQVLIDTSDDESYAGLIKSESAETLTILTSQAQLHTIAKSKITSRHNSALSLMPESLHLGLTPDEFTDLIAYLESLKETPKK